MVKFKKGKFYRAIINWHRLDDLVKDVCAMGEAVIVSPGYKQTKDDPYPNDWAFLLVGNDLKPHTKYNFWLTERDLTNFEYF